MTFQKYRSDARLGIVSAEESLQQHSAIVKSLTDIMEETIIDGREIIWMEYTIQEEQRFKIDPSIIEQTTTLLADADTEKCLDLLQEYFTQHKIDARDDIILLKARLIENDKNQLIGLDYEANIRTKTNRAIQLIIKEYT